MPKYTGRLYESDYGEAQDLLFLDTVSGPLAEELADEIAGKQVSVRYWVSSEPMPPENGPPVHLLLQKLYGIADVDYGSVYSEYTGYLWTMEDVSIGGHDLLEELRSHLGKYLYLEIDIHA